MDSEIAAIMMFDRTSSIHLIQATGITEIDSILRHIVQQVKLGLPDRIRGCYLVGSYAVGEAIATSDLDIIAVCKGSPSAAEKQQLTSIIAAECQRLNSLDFDVKLVGETHLLSTGSVRFHRDSLLLSGEDIRAQVPPKPVAEHIRDSLYAQYDLFARVRPHLQVLTVPLTYPDPQGQFYGYNRRFLRTIDGVSHPGIKDLALIVFGAASALTLLQAGEYTGTGRKSDIARQYRDWIGDDWTPLVEKVDLLCRQQWAYLIPSDMEQQQQLSMLCEQTLGFENHFLDEYKFYLMAQMPQAEPFFQLRYVQRLGQLIYADRAITDLLKTFEHSDNADIRKAATEALQHY